MKRALVYASVASMIQQFNMDNIRLLQRKGYQIDVACNMEQGSTINSSKIIELKKELERLNISVYHIPIPRNTTKLLSLMKSYIQTKKMIDERKYDLIHCHSPIGGMICRVAYRLSKQYRKAKLIYTAHGFHFYKGAPLKNWLIYYPVEKICAHFTDVLITINSEDFEMAKAKMKARQITYVPGIGIDTNRLCNVVVDRRSKREELSIPQEATVLISVGELNANKNHEVVIRAMKEIDNEELYYLIIGKGKNRENLERLCSQLGLQKRVLFLGYRSDIAELYKSSDICIFPSYREGLSVALMEAMCCGLPCIVSRIRGNIDLIDENGGKLFEPSSASSCAHCIEDIDGLREMGAYNKSKVHKFDVSVVMDLMNKIY